MKPCSMPAFIWIDNLLRLILTGFNPRTQDKATNISKSQSTRPRGARQKIGLIKWGTYLVSIHAPARGATYKSIKSTLTKNVSIHAPARGATRRYCLQNRVRLCFNPRARAGRDFRRALLRMYWHSFNPRARAGRDIIKKIKKRLDKMFQSTRPRGARPEGIVCKTECDSVSIHAPARGATLSHTPTPFECPVSIHAPARGAT